MKQHSEGSCDVIVTGPGSEQVARRCWNETPARSSGQKTQPFKHFCDFRAGKCVVTMLSLDLLMNQVLQFQTIQMNTRRGGAYLREHRKLGARPRAAVREAIEHPCPRRLADRRGNL